ncbi:MAG: NHLP bacteriocin export ABC transporter permease/ATPase subunit [Chloroflexi bacterium]|nr:NHLP bacteriocin export ABC transporter permease/ATPase subunit [Chloroflexota bacterium]
MTGGNPDPSPADRLPSDRLMEVALARGERFVGGGNRPFRLSGHDALWIVVQGSVDVFATRQGEDGVPTEFKHLLRAGPGRLIFPLSEESGDRALVVKGLPDSELRKVPFDTLTDAGLDALMVQQADAWVSEVSDSIVRDVTYRPRMDLSITAGDTRDVGGGAAVSAQDGVLWMSSQDGDLEFLGTEGLDPSGAGLVPVTALSWVVQNRAASVRASSTQDLLREGNLPDALLEFNRLAIRADDTNRTLALADVFNLRTASAQHRQRSEEDARLGLFSVLSGQPPRVEGDSTLLRALHRVGSHENIHFRAPLPSQQSASHGSEASLEEIISASGVRTRSVALRHHQRWWLNDSGAMLAYVKDDDSPVALIPGTLGRYVMFDAQTQRSVAVNSRRAAALAPAAHSFYRPLPDRRRGPVGLILGMVLNRVTGDLLRLVVAGVLSGLAMLTPPVLLGIFVSQVLPSGDLQMLAMLALTMLLTGVAFALLNMLRGTALMRLEGRATARISAAIWDRMLVLPSAFFRRFTVGDLGSRAMGFQQLRDQVAGVVAGAFLSLVFLLPAFALLFFYDTFLGVLGLAIGLFSLGVTVVLGLRQLPHHRRLLATSRHLTGVLLQLITGVAKLRGSGAESSAFAMWATNYREKKHAEMQLGKLNEHLIAFTAAVPSLAMAGLLAVALYRSDQGLSVGSFLAAYAAFMVFYGAVAQFGLSFSAIAAILPTIEQAQPVFAESPRRAPVDAPAIDLKGEVRVDHVTFRYTEDGPMILQDVSIHARPGEFIALVGESGSGKSTLLRLALGLESPQSGVVYYDGHDLARVNRQSVRDGVGMVVQNASLRPQTILDNIIGTGNDLTVEDAWRAARLASVDSDIAEMPMGMYTVTSEGSSAFSGGQTQRIMLAAALVRSPSVLLLDEATNWLDNATQSKVMDEIENLSVTRIVSAHRLSTIQRATRIYVLERGRVIQQGAFEDLKEQDGVFRDMALRQMS